MYTRLLESQADRPPPDCVPRSDKRTTGRERKAQRERDAELDKLTIHARLAAVTARELTVATLTQVYRQLIHWPVHGSGHVANGAAKLVLELGRAAIEDEPEHIEGVAWENMTPAQRAAAPGVIDREIVRLARLEEVSEPETGPDG
jgi:hypothetical protein